MDKLENFETAEWETEDAEWTDDSAVEEPETDAELAPEDGDGDSALSEPAPAAAEPAKARLTGRKGPRRTLSPATNRESRYTSPEQRLQLLDLWQRSGLPAGDFAGLISVSKHTLYAWKKRFDEGGPAGLMDQPRGGPRGSRVAPHVRSAIVLLKRQHVDWGCQRIAHELMRGPGLAASPGAITRILREEGYELEEQPTHPHPDKKRRFERARPNQLWQTDIFTFVLKRQNRRVFLVAFMDDHSRFIVSHGLHAAASTALVIDVLLAGIASYHAPEEVLTDQGPQYHTWRGKSRFTVELEKRGIRQIVARARHPQTLGKAERFWGTLWRECLEAAVFRDLDDARQRLALFVDHYNFQRPHQALDGLVPADRFFGAAPEIARSLKERVARNALELARQGAPRRPFYVTGQVGGQSFSVHAEGERVILKPGDGPRQEVELVRPPAVEPAVDPLPAAVSVQAQPAPTGLAEGNEVPPAPGVSPVDALEVEGASEDDDDTEDIEDPDLAEEFDGSFTDGAGEKKGDE